MNVAMELDTGLRSEPGAMSLMEILGILWWGKWIIALVAALVVGMTALYLNSATPRYTAKMVVAPLTGVGGGRVQRQRLGSFVGSVRTLLSAPERIIEFDKLRVVISSVPLAERLQEKHGLLQVIFANSWDAKAGRWKRPPAGDRVSRWKKSIKSALQMPGWQAPDIRTLANYLGGIKIARLPELALWEIRFEHSDPEFAERLLKMAYEEAEVLLRQQKIGQYNAQIEYVKSRLRRIAVVEHRLALTTILGDSERQLMAAQAVLPVASEIVEPATVSSKPSWPRSRATLTGSVALGLLLGLLAALLAYAFLRHRHDRRA